ncbi:MAG: hypothetical protein P8X55_09835, partial [Desulfosarcinaceae bacterium]
MTPALGPKPYSGAAWPPFNKSFANTEIDVDEFAKSRGRPLSLGRERAGARVRGLCSSFYIFPPFPPFLNGKTTRLTELAKVEYRAEKPYVGTMQPLAAKTKTANPPQ